VSSSALESALAAAGIIAAVEERDRLAIIVAASEEHSRSIAARRPWVVSTAAAHGFSHVALEIVRDEGRRLAVRGDASLPGD
jgi:hypothetical protein